MKFDLQLPHREQIVVITDRRVGALYAEQLVGELREFAGRVNLLTIEGEEACKNQQTKADLERQLFELGAQRNTLIVALGGGVVGDLAGFVAATYMRGIDYVQVPTTVLAMVDSSIGGKTGVNTDYGKNLIGAIWHPIEIIRRPQLLATLDDDQLVNGMVEIAKIFLTCDALALEGFNQDLEQILARDIDRLVPHIERAIELKIAIVSRDEREKGERAILNFGHTVGHGFELLSNYSLLHGFAIGMGIWVETGMARHSGHLADADFEVVTEILGRLKIGATACQDWSADELWDAMRHDKKAGINQINYIALAGIGKVYRPAVSWVQPMEKAFLERAYQEFLAS